MENTQQQEMISGQARHNLEEIRFALAFLNHSFYLFFSQQAREKFLPSGTPEGVDIASTVGFLDR